MTKALFPDLIVNGERIPQAVVAAEAQNHNAPRGKPGLAWRAAANAVSVRALLLQDAHTRGLKPKPEAVGPGKSETEEEALIRQVLDDVVEITAPTEDELRAEWQKDPSRFRSPPLWEVSHIRCACNPADEAGRTKAEARAKSLTGVARENPKDFAALARRESDCGSKSAGGMLGQLNPGDTVPEFEAALHDLKDGQVASAPVLTRFGWHVIRMDAVGERRTLPFDAVRQKISDAIEKAAWARAARSYVSNLVANAEITGADPGTL